MHNLMSLPPQDNPTQPLLTSGAANRFAASPLIVFGAQDSQERPWTTIWGGTPGSAQSMGNSVLALKSEVDAKYDPVVEALFGNGDGSGGVEAGKVVRKQVMVSGLAIDLERRLRWKMSGKFLAGAVQEGGEDVDDQVLPKKRKMEVQMAVQVEQSLGKSHNPTKTHTTNPFPRINTQRQLSQISQQQTYPPSLHNLCQAHLILS